MSEPTRRIAGLKAIINQIGLTAALARDIARDTRRPKSTTQTWSVVWYDRTKHDEVGIYETIR
jgi:hypothetical protein